MKKSGWFFTFAMAFCAITLVGFNFCESSKNIEDQCYDPIPLNIPKYDFIQYQLNELQGNNLDSSFNNFFNKLDQVLSSPDASLNIVHMGGSHVQAGVLSHRLRQHFQHLACDLDAERGLFFPFRLAKTNGPRHLKMERVGEWESTRCAHNKQRGNWGMTGFQAISVADSSGLDVQAYHKDSISYLFDEIQLIHDGPIPDFIYPFPDSLSRDSALRTTRYFWSFPQDTLSIRWNKADSACVYGMIWKNKERAITYHGIGVNGASTRSYLRCERMDDELKMLNADLVVFGIGINDAYMSETKFDPNLFESRYDTLVNYFKAANPEVKFIWLTNNDSYYKKRYPNKNALKVSQVMRSLADKHDGAVWDLFGIMGGLGSVRDWQDAGLANEDKIHFTKAGYELQADLFFDAFRRTYTRRIRDRVESLNPVSP